MSGRPTKRQINDDKVLRDQTGSGFHVETSRLGIVICIIFLLLMSLWLALPPAARAATQSERYQGIKQQIESDLSKEKKAYETFESKEKRLIDEFSKLEKASKDIEQEIEKINRQIELAESDIKGLDEKLLGLERSLKESQDRLGSRMTALYKHARKGYLKGLIRAEDLMDLRQRAKFVSAVIRKDQEALAVWASTGQKCREDITVTRSRLQETANRRNEAEEQRARLRDELEGMVVRLMNVHREKEFYETGVKELELAARGMGQTLIGLTKGDGGYRGGSSVRFADSRGSLPLPMDGRMVAGPKGKGSIPESAFQLGVFFESVSKQEVKAVFSGRVDFSGKLKGYGETIIVNHGDRFFTLYAFLAGRTKGIGESVNQGEVIGRVGKAEDRVEKRLYFEIRESDKALSPTDWFARR